MYAAFPLAEWLADTQLATTVKVESAGNTTPQRLFPLAVNVMRLKIQKLKQDIHEHLIPKWQSQDRDVTMADA